MHAMFNKSVEQGNPSLISVSPRFQESAGIKWWTLPQSGSTSEGSKMKETHAGTFQIAKVTPTTS